MSHKKILYVVIAIIGVALLVALLLFAMGRKGGTGQPSLAAQVSGATSASSYIEATFPTNVGQTNATLNGTIDLENLADFWGVQENTVRYWFQYSLNSTAGGAGSTSTSAAYVFQAQAVSGSDTVSKTVMTLQPDKTYYYRLCATGGAGKTACGVKVKSFATCGTTPSIRITSPNGGESFNIQDTFHPYWTTCGISQSPGADLYIVDMADPSVEYSIGGSESGFHAAIAHTPSIAQAPSLGSSNFKIKAVEGATGVTDMSDDTFAILGGVPVPTLSCISPQDDRLSQIETFNTGLTGISNGGGGYLLQTRLHNYVACEMTIESIQLVVIPADGINNFNAKFNIEKGAGGTTLAPTVPAPYNVPSHSIVVNLTTPLVIPGNGSAPIAVQIEDVSFTNPGTNPNPIVGSAYGISEIEYTLKDPQGNTLLRKATEDGLTGAWTAVFSLID